MKKLIDLHTHSVMSDGSMTPTEVVQHAKENGISAISLTDHDSIAGVKEAMEAGKKYGVEVIPGIELSVQSETETHILGYFIDIEHPSLKEGMIEILKVREFRNRETCRKINELGFDVTMEEALALAPNKIVGRAHFAKVMADKGYVESVKDAFAKYLKNGKPAYCGVQALTSEEAIELIHNCGGKAYVAHLHLIRLSDDELREFLVRLKGVGLDGIEGYYTEYTPEMQEKYQDLARELDLEISGGTDFHAQMKPHISIGRGLGDLEIPYSVLENIRP